MDGIHDLGGKEGFGSIQVENNEPYFHDRWEAGVFAMVINLGDNTDRFRHAVERIDPVSYLTDTYYGRWLGGLESKLIEEGLISQADIKKKLLSLGVSDEGRVAARPSESIAREFKAKANQEYLNAARPMKAEPIFKQGQTVVVSSTGASGHTRLPAYVRGRRGLIVALHGGWVLPDTHAHGLGENPEHLYTVSFSGVELWGKEADPGLEICIDLFESYIEGYRDE